MEVINLGQHEGLSVYKVVDFGTNRKRLSICLLAIATWSCLAPFLRCGNVLAEKRQFSLPHSHLTPSLPRWGEPLRISRRTFYCQDYTVSQNKAPTQSFLMTLANVYRF